MSNNHTVTTTEARERRDTVQFCAFWSLAIAATLFVVAAILNVVRSVFGIDGNAALNWCISIFELLAKVALLVAIGIPAYGYVRGRKKAWKIFFWVALVIYALGVVFSVIHF